MTAIKTRTRTTHYADIPDVGELDTDGFDLSESWAFEPEWHTNPDNPREGVLLFSQHDDWPSNPLEDGDCEGEIYHTNRDYLRYNVGEVDSAFGLDDGVPALQLAYESLPADELAVRLAPLYRANLSDDELLELIEDALEREDTDPTFQEILPLGMYSTAFAVNWYSKDVVRFDDIVAHALFEHIRAQSYWDNLPAWARVAEGALTYLWRELREQGVIGHPLAVPLSVGGRYCERYSVCNDRFPDERPDGVWYPNDGALMNLLRSPRISDVSGRYEWQPCDPEGIGGSKAQQWGDDKANGTYRAYVQIEPRQLSLDGQPMCSYQAILDKLWPALNAEERQTLWEQAYQYADGVCKTYSAWAEGDCHGIVCLTYTQTDDGEWELTDNNTCWGYVGHESAEECRFDVAPAWLRK